MEPKQNIRLFIDKREQGIKRPDGTYSENNVNDFFITTMLTKDSKLVDEYVDISIDPTKETMDRQFVNPYFMELGFFETIDRIGLDTDSETREDSVKGKSKKFDIDINS